MNTRFALRLLRLKCLRGGQRKEAQAVAEILRDPELFELFNEYINTQFCGSLTDLLNWIIENADEIIAFIVKIIDLFSEA
jgi:hypothetical protein